MPMSTRKWETGGEIKRDGGREKKQNAPGMFFHIMLLKEDPRRGPAMFTGACRPLPTNSKQRSAGRHIEDITGS